MCWDSWKDLSKSKSWTSYHTFDAHMIDDIDKRWKFKIRNLVHNFLGAMRDVCTTLNGTS